jgi:IPT/TIG domain
MADRNPGTADPAETPASAQTPDLIHRWGAMALGIYFFILATLMFYFLVSTWPVRDPKNIGQFADFNFLFWGPIKDVLPDTRLFLTVIAAGAVGSLIHTLTSFSDFVGNRKLGGSWIWWFILRTPVGIALALLFYLVTRSGFITVPSNSTNPDTTNPYGIAAISALAGMFSKQATDKLREVFDTLFHTREPVDRADPLKRVIPVISGTTPAKLKVGGRDLTVMGREFQPDCKVLINGSQRASQRTSDTQISVTLDAGDIARPGQLQLVLENTGQGGGKSVPFFIVVEA